MQLRNKVEPLYKGTPKKKHDSQQQPLL